eukprot:jgi/Tetstr1/443609/TSEL_031608.t1
MAVPGQPLRVAVLGGGVGGCSFVAGLRAASEMATEGGPPLLRGHPLEVSLFEMGRGVGGRAASRASREMPGMQCDHGVPFYEARSERFQAINASLAAGGYVTAFDDVVGTLHEPAHDAKEGAIWDFKSEDCPPGASRYRGIPGMNGLCAGLVGAWPGLTPRFSTMIAGIEPPSPDGSGSWHLLGRDRGSLGEFDWLVVAGNGVAHPRWTPAFGGPPPLVEAAAKLGDPSLTAALHTMAPTTARPVTAVMMAFTGEAAQEWAALPWSLARFEDDPVLGKLMVRALPDSDTVTVVLHSSHAFAEGATHVFGSTSTAARVGGAAGGSSAEEGEVVGKLLGALRPRVVGVGGLSAAVFEGAAWGPHLHRWGNAFPGRPLLPSHQAACPGARLLFCGDYVEAGGGEDVDDLERAALSGFAAAEVLAGELSK